MRSNGLYPVIHRHGVEYSIEYQFSRLATCLKSEKFLAFRLRHQAPIKPTHRMLPSQGFASPIPTYLPPPPLASINNSAPQPATPRLATPHSPLFLPKQRHNPVPHPSSHETASQQTKADTPRQRDPGIMIVVKSLVSLPRGRMDVSALFFFLLCSPRSVNRIHTLHRYQVDSCLSLRGYRDRRSKSGYFTYLATQLHTNQSG
ncbi:hypothetical protein IQ07DRAFT_295261 [Pyrenochaeta sp. DS3sAY3a]|nr:hypothetical protein IQ07DRAFT_295261 [Pyrenochaeta sp. DS3sAY3a]